MTLLSISYCLEDGEILVLKVIFQTVYDRIIIFLSTLIK